LLARVATVDAIPDAFLRQLRSAFFRPPARNTFGKSIPKGHCKKRIFLQSMSKFTQGHELPVALLSTGQAVAPRSD
jgi:hypothetical protein